jgi:hypothetical protein
MARRPRRRDNPPIGATPQHPVKEEGLRARAEAAAAWIVPSENPGGMVYGAIIVGALLATESGQHETYTATVAATVVATLLSWLAHSYAVVLGRRLEGGQPVAGLALLRALVAERVLLRGTVVPLVILLGAWAAGIEEITGVTVAIWSVVASLVIFELIAGLRSHSSLRELIVDVTVGLTMGIGILVLKVVLH